jgi:hypothetical protein
MMFTDIKVRQSVSGIVALFFFMTKRFIYPASPIVIRHSIRYTKFCI